MKEESSQKVGGPPQVWDESRVVVFLIGICLIIEAALIYYQAGDSQAAVSAIVGVSGITLLIFAWLVPLEEDNREEKEDPLEYKEKEKPLPLERMEPGKIPVIDREEPVANLVEHEEKAPPPEEKPENLVAVEKKPEPREPVLSWFEQLTFGLKKTRDGFVKKIKTLVLGSAKIDDDLLDEIEGTLFEADIGVNTTKELLAILHKEVEAKEIKDSAVIYGILKDELKKRLTRLPSHPKMNSNGMTVFLIIGVNGVGKTTSIAKLAYKYVQEGKKVVLAAGDTFRAAAIEQLSIWGERAGAEVIKSKEGGDPGALVFDAIHAAKKRDAHLLIVDTAGRMHVKINLMDELKKIMKILEKETDGGPHEILLVIDATTGQNAVQQAKLFNEALPVSGFILTKLDGTAKGGVVFSLEENLNVPVKFIGVGEKMADLLHFEPEQFLEALFADDATSKESDYKVL